MLEKMWSLNIMIIYGFFLNLRADLISVQLSMAVSSPQNRLSSDNSNLLFLASLWVSSSARDQVGSSSVALQQGWVYSFACVQCVAGLGGPRRLRVHIWHLISLPRDLSVWLAWSSIRFWAEFQEHKKWNLQFLLKEATYYQFCHILLANTNHKASLYSREGENDPTSSWEERSNFIAKDT